MKSVFSH